MYFMAQILKTSFLTLPRKKPFIVYKIFQMDYNRNTKEYRMLDCFLPQVRSCPAPFCPPHHIKTRNFLIVLQRLGRGKESQKMILISFQAQVHGPVK